MLSVEQSPVVSVRLDRALVERLDALVERTGRSRGYYLREAIADALPALEERYWAHSVVDKTREEERIFGDLMRSLNDAEDDA